MSKQIIIAEQHRVAAVFSEDQIQELIVATGTHQISDIYLGIVENVLPAINAAFVNIGDSDRNGFIHADDLGPLKLRRSGGSITELLVPQQKVLVQIMKEPTGNKGPRLTGNITLPGRYLVLMPHGKGVNLSQKIRNENERNRLRALAILTKPAGMGLIVRTEAEGISEDAIIKDLEMLQEQWESIQQEAGSTRAPALLNRDDDFIQRVLRDMYSTDVNRIVVDSHTGLKRVKQQLVNWSAGKSPQGVSVDHHRDRVSILEYFRVNAAIREALKPRVDLPSGGYLIIEPTEALTVVDVNSGSFTRSATARETVLWTNCEAATELARQLRLRNLAGVIIVDFIDMDTRRDKLQVLEYFNKALKTDKARPQIAQLSELGLVELTRKRQGQNIYELFGRTCPTCGGLGHLVHLPGEVQSDVDETPEYLGAGVSALEAHPADVRRRSESQGYSRRARSSGTGDRFEGLPSSRRSEPPTQVKRFYTGNAPDLDSSDEMTAPAAISARDGGNVTETDLSPLTSWQDRSHDAYASPDIGELDLGNHPSYNDRGSNSGNRRRRRRGGSSEPRSGYEGRADVPSQNRRDASREVGLQPVRETATLSQRTEVRESGRREGGARVARARLEPTMDVEAGLPSEEVSTYLPKEALASKGDRSRPARREGGKSAAPTLELISVEMTPEEQDIYALMGISPLVLANREVTDPKSAIVLVTLPGQTPEITPNIFSNPSTFDLQPTDDVEPVRAAALDLSNLEVDPIQVDASESELLPTPVITTDVIPVELPELDVSETSPTRRRRRRSSASDSTAEEE